MTLRNKLIASFLGVLTLSTMIGFVGWYGMDIMGRKAEQAVIVEKAGMDLLLAKISQLRFIVFADPHEITLTKNYLAESIATFQTSLKSIDQPERLDETRAIITTLGRYQGMVDTLEQRTAEISKLDHTLTENGQSIQTGFKTLLDNIARIQRETNAPEEFDYYVKVNDSRVLFNQALFALLEYRTNPNNDNSAPALKAAAACRANLEQVAGSLRLPANITLMKSIQSLLADYDKELGQIIALQAMQDSLITNIHRLVIETVTTVVTSADSANTILKATRDKAVLFVILITAAAFAMGMIISLLLARSIHHQLGTDPGQLAAIARRVTLGDFSIGEKGQQRGVFGALIEMVKTLRTHIESANTESERAKAEAGKAQQAIMEAEEAHHQAEIARREGILDAANQLEGIVTEVNSAADRLSTQIKSAELGAAEQAGRSSETATAMEEMNSTILEVARNAAAGSDASFRTRKKAEDGSQVMGKAVKSIQVVHEQSATVRNNMLALTEHVRAIDAIMGVISDIADQTNLLALNAAIEAARAGDAGRGFAVVADEVRKLAEKTMASTTDVEKMVRDIQRSAEENMRQVDVTVREIENATTLAGQSGEMLGEILTLVDDTADQARSIATASEEQSAASEEINRAMNQNNAIASQTAEAMQEASHAVVDLAKQTTMLNNLVEHLKES